MSRSRLYSPFDDADAALLMNSLRPVPAAGSHLETRAQGVLKKLHQLEGGDRLTPGGGPRRSGRSARSSASGSKRSRPADGAAGATRSAKRDPVRGLCGWSSSESFRQGG